MQGYQDPQFNARSLLAQNLVDRGRAYIDQHDRDFLSGSSSSGPMCFSRYIRLAVIPSNFRLATGISKFSGDSKPETWLDDYRVVVQIGGGNDDVTMKHLPLMLEGSARAWLNQLPPSNIYSWDDLFRVFLKNFKGTYKQPGGLAELQHCVHKQNENLREYIQRWTTLHNSVKNVTEH